MSSTPSGLLIFGIVFAAVVGVLLLMAIISRLSRWGRGEVTLLPDWARRTVKPSHVVMSRPLVTPPSDQPDRPADRLSVSAKIEEPPRLQLDRTRTALIEELLTLGWTMTDFRREQIFRGDNNKISAEVESARQRLGIESGDHRTPIAGRPTSAVFADPELLYQPPPR